jgi:predicted transcriptional regulator
MDLHNVRSDLHRVLKQRQLSLVGFARKHEIGSSWLYKFSKGTLDNPRFNTLEQLQKAIKCESEAS